MPQATRNLKLLVVLVALIVHAFDTFHHYEQAHRRHHGFDFASYFYAARVAADGGNPYARVELGNAARDEETRGSVHPYFYPPPALLAFAWTLPLELMDAYRIWFWLNEIAALAAALALWWWWRDRAGSVGVAIAMSVAWLTAIPNNALMGQANLPVLLLVIGGLWSQERGRDVLGGILVGTACMWKMSPAVFVMYWLLSRRWKAAAASVVWAVVLSIAVLPMVRLGIQVEFFTEVLPEFRNGNYNNLTVPIDLFGNHSIPNLLDQMLPAGGAHLKLSEWARRLSSLSTLGLLATMGWVFRHRTDDDLTESARWGAVGIAVLLIPVYTYEHHLVWGLFAVVALVAAIERGRLSRRWVLPLAFAIAAWAFDLAYLKKLYQVVHDAWPITGFFLQEVKFVALGILWVACLVVGAQPDRPALGREGT